MSDAASSQPALPADDSALVERLRRGEEAAFRELVESRGPRLLAAARRLMGDEHEAQDCLQDAFIRAFRAIGRFEGRSMLSTWLHRIVINVCMTRLAARTRRAEESIDDLLPGFDEDGWRSDAVPAAERGVESIVAEQENRVLIRTAIDQLPENYRTVIMLRDLEELDTAETAEVLGITTTAVKLRLHRARAALRAKLEPLFVESKS